MQLGLLARDSLGNELRDLGRRGTDLDTAGLERFLLRLGSAGRAGDDRAGVAHRLAGRGGEAGDVGEDGLGHLLADETGGPFLLVAASGLRRGEQRLEGALGLALAFAASLALHGRHHDWMGGYCYGPRFALHGLGAVVAMLATPLERVWRSIAGRILFAASVVFSVGLQAVGAFCYPGNDSGNERHLYHVASSSPVRAWQAGPQPPHFLDLVMPGLAADRPLAPEQARALYEWEATPPPDWPSDTVRDVQVRVTNLGDTRWSSVGGRLGRGGVRWRVRWLRVTPEGAEQYWEEERWAFFDLEPGATSSRALSLASPPFEGPAVLEIGMTQSGLANFEALGVPPLRSTVRLEPFRP